MGLFSFGNKDEAPSERDAYSDSPRGSRQTVRTERRTRRTERPDADAMMLDPTLPEKQRARRRLVGAIALVAAAVIILPMVLDSHPKPVTDDISIEIPTRPAPPLPKSSQNDTPADVPPDSQAGVGPDNPTAGAAASDSAVAGLTTPAVKPEAKPQTQGKAQTAQTAPAPEAKPSATVAQAAKPPATTSTTTSTTASAPKPNTPASPAGSRFVIQIGAFDEDAPAQNWVTKLKAAGVPAYTEHRKQADGSTRTLLRAGPFPDRASAAAALQKVREAGLGGGNGGNGGNGSGSSGSSNNASAN
jgi:DedD protein